MTKKKNCFICSKEKLTQNEIGLNKKLIDPQIKRFQCINCIADHFQVSIEELEAKIQDFIDSDCLFFA